MVETSKNELLHADDLRALRPGTGCEIERTLSPAVFSRMMDVIDYGLLLVVGDSQLVYSNQVARAELDEAHPLQCLGRELRARHSRDVVPLRQAVAAALLRGVQTMVTLGRAAEVEATLTVVPVGAPAEGQAAMIILGKRRGSEDLSTDAFARQHRLTDAETRVLKMLCAGCRPQDIATAFGRKLTTVRTQIGNIRAKTGSRDIGEIVQRVARLPPMACVVRRAA